MKRTQILTVILLIAILTTTLTSCGHTHQFDDWQVVKSATCTESGEQERYCDCGEKQTNIIPKKNHDWAEATCTLPKTCTRCNTTEGNALGHTVSIGKCNRCYTHFAPDISIPNVPITVSGNGQRLKLTELTYSYIGDIFGGGTFYFRYSGEKIYDNDGLTSNDSCWFIYKVYDAEGILVHSGSELTSYLSVGDKFSNETFSVSVGNSTSYTLVIEDYK